MHYEGKGEGMLRENRGDYFNGDERKCEERPPKAGYLRRISLPYIQTWGK